MDFIGFVSLSSTIYPTFVTRDNSNIPTNAASAPGFRVYGSSGLMANGTGTATQRDTGSITGATNASPIVITSTSHKLTTGTRVTIAGVGGNTAANGTFSITNVDVNSFSLDGSTGNGAYTSGGTWNVSGLYYISFSPTAANGFEAGQSYSMLVSYTVSSTAKADVFAFTVV